MITVKSMRQIATSKTIPSFRAVPALGRSHHIVFDQGRRVAGEHQRLAHDAHRQWRNQLWSKKTQGTKP